MKCKDCSKNIDPRSKRCKRCAKRGVRHHVWKGNGVGYYALHTWINRELGSPKKCDRCGTTKAKKYEWSNISGEYKRDLSDWERVCTTCHQKKDGHGYGNIAKSRPNFYNRWSGKWEERTICVQS